MEISVQINGSPELIAKLERLGSEIKNFKSAFRDLGKDLVSYYEDTVFNSMGGVYGTPWMKLSPSTIAQKIMDYKVYAAVPLMRSGDMRKGFKADASATELTIYNQMPYFVYHQSSEPRTKLPRRQMIGVNNDIRELIKKVITEDINQKIRNA